MDYTRTAFGKEKKRPKSSSVTGVTGGVVTPKDKTRVLFPSPFALPHFLNIRLSYKKINFAIN